MISLEVELLTGAKLRLAADEANDERKISGFKFDTQMPGGCHTASCTVARPAVLKSDEQLRWARVTAYKGKRRIYAGRITSAKAATDSTLTLEMEGLINLLADDQTFREIYVISDLGVFDRGPTPTWSIVMQGAGYAASQGSVAKDEGGNPAIALTCQGDWGSTGKPSPMVAFRSPVPLGSVFYSMSRGANVSNADGNWAFDVLVEPTDNWTGLFDTSGDLQPSGAGPYTGTVNVTSTANRNVRLALYYNAGPAGGAGVDYSLYVTAIGLFGRHALTKQGAGSTTLPPGLLWSDILKDVVQRTAPGLTIDDDLIDKPGTVIYNYAELEDTTGMAALANLIKLASSGNVINDYGVFEDGKFFCLPAAKRGNVWRVRADQVQLDPAGPSADDRWTGVKVNYKDIAGDSKSVGPTETNPDTVDNTLKDTDESNPAVQLGNRWYSLDVGVFQSADLAAPSGRMKLADLNSVYWTGNFKIAGTVRSQSGEEHPCDRVHAGDFLILEGDTEEYMHWIATTGWEDSGEHGIVSGSIGRPPAHYEFFSAAFENAEKAAAL